MSTNVTEEEIVRHKNKAIKQLKKMFEAFINSPNQAHKKKANLIAYWIEEYSQYLLMEERFNYKSVPKYRRGDVISLNFGFNVGSEHGGLHYAIVLDNDNKQSSPVVTVIPLSSGNEKNTYGRDIFLGSELYDKLNTKYAKFVSKIDEEIKELTKTLEILKNVGDVKEDKLSDEIEEHLNNLVNRVDNLSKERSVLQTYEKEIAKLKTGSVALMEQITTVSKMRIYKPKNSSDLLYGVRVSDGAMDKINERLKELYLFTK